MVLRITGDNEVTRAPLITLSDGEAPQTEEFSKTQGNKLHVALGEKSPGPDILSTAVANGTSRVYREMLAEQDVIARSKAQSDVLNTVLQSDPNMITSELVNVVRDLSMTDIEAPNLTSIIEQKYAKMYTNTAAAYLENDVLQDSMDASPDATYEVMDRAERVAYKRNYAQTKLDQVHQKLSEQSWGGAVWDFGERLVPFVEWYQKNDAVKEAENFTTSILPGNNLSEQYAYLWGLSDPEEFETALDATVESLEGANLQTAQSWLEGLFIYGGDSATIDNLFAVADVASFVPVTKFAKAMKAVSAVSTTNPARLERIATALGKNADAAVGKSVKEIGDGTFLGQGIRKSKELENSVPSITSPESLLSGADNVPQAAYLRLKESLLSRADLARKFLFEPNLVDRLAPEELAKYKDELLDDYKRLHPSIQSNVIDVRVNDSADVGNVYNAEVIIGQRDGTLFQNEGHARLYYSRWIKGSDDYRIEQVGEGYQIVIPKTVDESKFLTDLRLPTSVKTPEDLKSSFGWWRSPNYVVSRNEELQRSTVVTTSEKLASLYSEISKPFRDLPSKEFAELEDLMVINRDKNEFFENYSQFSEAFHTRFGKVPTEGQADVYFAYVQLNDLDLVIRDLDWYKQKARLGIEEVTLKLKDGDQVFEGKVVDHLPFGSRDSFAVVIEKDGVLGKPKRSTYFTEADKTEINKLREQGYRIVQVAGQDLAVGDRYAGFVVTDRAKTARIGVKNVDRKAGGHHVHKYPYYVKQGKISAGDGESLYRGDTTLFNAATDKEAREIVDALEVARVKVRDRTPDAVKYIRDNLPITPREFLKAVHSGSIDLNVPFAVTKKGQRAIDTGAYSNLPNVKDLGMSEHNLSGKITGKYGGERSETNIDIIRSEGENKFEIAGAPYLSPMDTLRASSNNVLSVRLVNDYTLSTNQNFLRQFGDILEGSREEQISSGVSMLVNPKFKDGADEARKSAALNVSRAYNNLMNHGTSLDRKIEFFKEKILQSVIDKTGARGKAYVEDRMLSRVKDPGQFLRSVAFNFKLGMFNPQQYFVQANSLVNVASIAGTRGMRGGLVYPMMRAALISNEPGVWKAMSKVADKVGLMKSDDFLESMALYRKSGFNDIGGDVAYLDDIQSPELRSSNIKQGVKSTLAWGRTPFNEGERLVRMAAWNAAYLERKEALKGARLSRRDEAIILQRAKDLSGNMTRESNSAWQKGYAAVFTQFFGYQARIMEQFIGKKLTSAEKLRLFTGYSMVYGVPTAMGATLGVVPVRDIVVDQMLAMGIDPNDTAVEPFIDGFAASMIEFMTGDELNVASRYGPGGLPTFYDLFRGDKEWYETFMGASGSIAMETIQDAAPILSAMKSEFMDGEGGLMNLTADDFLQPLRNISSVDNGLKLWHVANFGVWTSRNGTDITKMDLPEALTAAITGLTPSEIEDGFAKNDAIQDHNARIKSVQKELVREYRRIMKMDPGKTRESLTRQVKARMELEGFSLRDKANTWRYAADQEMVTDTFFKNYEEFQMKQGSKQ